MNLNYRGGPHFLLVSVRESDNIYDEWKSQDQASIKGQVWLVCKPLNSGLTPGLDK